MKIGEALKKWGNKEPKTLREKKEKHKDFNPNDSSEKNSSIKAGIVWR